MNPINIFPIFNDTMTGSTFHNDQHTSMLNNDTPDYCPDTTIVTADERSRRVDISIRFLNQLNVMRQKMVCGVCALSFTGEEMTNVSIEFLHESQVLRPFSQSILQGRALTNDMLLHRQSLSGQACSICQSCHNDLLAGIQPTYAIAGKWHMGVVPDELQNLSTMERLVITRRFQSVLHCTISKVQSVCGNETVFSAVPFRNLEHSIIETNQLPISSGILRRVFEMHFNLGEDEEMPALHCLEVRRSQVLAALEWLKKNNRVYTDIIILPENLDLLPDQGLPYQLLPFVNGRNGKLHVMMASCCSPLTCRHNTVCLPPIGEPVRAM